MYTTKLPKVISAEDLLSTPIPPTKWIIPGLLPVGLALFAGPSKAGKSWLTLWLCLQVAQGKPVWGREIESRTVLYLSLEDAKKNDIIPFNPAHRIRKKFAEKEKQHIPQKYEMQRLLKIIMDEPILYKAYYTMAIATGLRRGELCALRWENITGPYEFTIRHSRSYVAGQGIVESDTKNHRERVIVIPAQMWEFLMSLRHWQTIRSGKPDNSQPIFTDLDGHVPNPDTFTRHLRRLYAKNGFPQEYHLHTLRHYYATYLLQEGTSKQVAADLLGHADTAFLERTYCHPQNMAKREAANLMENLLSPKNIYYQPFKWFFKGKKVG